MADKLFLFGSDIIIKADKRKKLNKNFDFLQQFLQMDYLARKMDSFSKFFFTFLFFFRKNK